MEIFLHLLRQEDAKELFEFEKRNRVFFEKMVPGRGESYFHYENFLKIQQELLDEQINDTSYFYSIKDQSGAVAGRINLIDLDWDKRSAHIGYRVGEEYAGKGIAKRALSLLLENVVKPLSIVVFAKTTHNNLSSQKVLTHNDFQEIVSASHHDDENSETEFIYFKWEL